MKTQHVFSQRSQQTTETCTERFLNFISDYFQSVRNFFNESIWEKRQFLLRYVSFMLLLTFLAAGAAWVRWRMIDSDAYFTVNTPAKYTYYAVQDKKYASVGETEHIRALRASGVLSVLAQKPLEGGFDMNASCELLVNAPLQLAFLPLPLRSALNAMDSDARELFAGDMRQIWSDMINVPGLRDSGQNGEGVRSARDEVLWQLIGKWNSEAKTSNLLFQVLSCCLNESVLPDGTLDDQVRKQVGQDVEPLRRVQYAGECIVEKGAIITPAIASLLRLQGYTEEQSCPLGIMFCATFVAWGMVLWIQNDLKRNFSVAGKTINWHYPFFLMVVGWGVQLILLSVGGILMKFVLNSWEPISLRLGVMAVSTRVFSALGLLPAIAVVYLTLPKKSMFVCSAAIVVTGSVISTGYDTGIFASDMIAGIAALVMGPFVFRRLFSRFSVWKQIMELGVGMFCAVLAVQWRFVSRPELFMFSKSEWLHGVLLLLGVTLLTLTLLSVLVMLALPWVERYFDVISPLQLIQMTHPSYPLLRRIQMEAPGTFYHCQMVGNLAESAGAAIGLNALLMRAGACYHDIGKLRRPQSFVENQHGENTHDFLSPTMSAMVILSHVKDGLTIAAEYHMPGYIHSFIHQHHGTTCLTYFYKKARQSGMNVEQSQFCYPGPKPQSKETALLMIADSVEAAFRGPRAPFSAGGTPEQRVSKTVNAIEKDVHNIIRSKLEAGQFDDVDFTCKELMQIQNAMVQCLSSMHHQRNIKPLRQPQNEHRRSNA